MALQPLKLAPLDGVEAAKRAAAYAAVDNHVKPEHSVIGIGSGKHSICSCAISWLILLSRIHGSLRC